MDLVLLVRHHLRLAIGEACADAALAVDDPRLSVVLLPRVWPAVARIQTEGLLNVSTGTRVIRTYATEPSRRLVAGDLVANIVWLREKKLLAAGHSAMVVSVGAGLTVTCMILHAGRASPGGAGGSLDGYGDCCGGADPSGRSRRAAGTRASPRR
jgi:3-oxoacyl-[acyl-carrier-protein] synthase-3